MQELPLIHVQEQGGNLVLDVRLSFQIIRWQLVYEQLQDGFRFFHLRFQLSRSMVFEVFIEIDLA